MTFRKASIERSLTTKKHATLSISIVTLPSAKLPKKNSWQEEYYQIQQNERIANLHTSINDILIP
jgi:hypothetical protein